MTQPRNIVVIGGGFAGTAVMRRLNRALPAGWSAILLSEDNYMVYTPLLPEVVAGSLLPVHAVAPLRRIATRTEYHRGTVTGIDFAARVVHYRERVARELPYEHLVLATGAMAKLDLVPGMERHALPLKTLGDALHLRNLMIERLEQAELEQDLELRRSLLRFFVIGGGSSGVEVSGAVRDFLDAARAQYHHVVRYDIEVVLMESGGRLLPEYPASLGEFALHALEDEGVQVQLGTRVARITADHVVDQAGKHYRVRNVICTIGTAPCPLIADLNLAKRKGRLVTQPDLSLADAVGLWAAGDCAAVPNRATGGQCPPTAQMALRQGTVVADNILRRIGGRATRPFAYRSRGEMASVGYHRAVARVFGFRLRGFGAWLLWRAFYLMRLPTVLRKLQVFFEWNIEMLFPQDVTQMYFTRTGQRAAREARLVEAEHRSRLKLPAP